MDRVWSFARRHRRTADGIASDVQRGPTGKGDHLAIEEVTAWPRKEQREFRGLQEAASRRDGLVASTQARAAGSSRKPGGKYEGFSTKPWATALTLTPLAATSTPTCWTNTFWAPLATGVAGGSGDWAERSRACDRDDLPPASLEHLRKHASHQPHQRVDELVERAVPVGVVDRGRRPSGSRRLEVRDKDVDRACLGDGRRQLARRSACPAAERQRRPQLPLGGTAQCRRAPCRRRLG